MHKGPPPLALMLTRLELSRNDASLTVSGSEYRFQLTPLRVMTTRSELRGQKGEQDARFDHLRRRELNGSEG